MLIYFFHLMVTDPVSVKVLNSIALHIIKQGHSERAIDHRIAFDYSHCINDAYLFITLTMIKDQPLKKVR